MYGASGGIDCQVLANLHELQRMQQVGLSSATDWLRVLPASRSHLTGYWRSSVTELHNWRPIQENARYQPLNLNVGGDKTVNSWTFSDHPRRRQHQNDDGQGPTDPGTDERYPIKRRTKVANGRRFDFTRLAESATKRDDSSATASDTEITAITQSNGGVKVVKCDDDQSDRRLLLKPDAAVEDSDKQLPICSLPHHSTTLQPLKSVFNPIEPFGRYVCRRHCLMIR